MWLRQVTHRVVNGQGRAEDIELLRSISGGIEGKTLCALGDFAIGPVLSSIKHFREEYEHHILHGTCPPGTGHNRDGEHADETFVVAGRMEGGG